MERAVNTGFKDKAGRVIYVGDFVQHRLGKFGKSGGAQVYRVIEHGKKFHLIREAQTDIKYGGIEMTQRFLDYAVVVKSDYISG